MAKLTAAARRQIPASKFGLPKERKYPMEDATHAVRAKGRATQQEKKGRLTPAQASSIKAKANRILHGGR